MSTHCSAVVVALDCGDDLVADLLAQVERPVCPICKAKAWPGDDARHIYSLHVAAEEAGHAS